MIEYILPAIINAFCTVFILALIYSVYSYAKEKGKNKAHKEDDKDLVRISENTRHVQDIKRDAILETLYFIDTYFSWITWVDSPLAAREPMSTEKLTVWARKCYNELSLSCSQSIVDKFLTLVFSNDLDLRKENSCLTKEYNEFRNLARKELGLEEINFSVDKVFISLVRTHDLEKTLKKIEKMDLRNN